MRGLLPDAPFFEQRMFGGLSFLLEGHITVSVSGSGGLLARVSPDDAEALLARSNVEPMAMGGRTMSPGWVRVTGELTDADLREWIDRCVAYARTLPPKR